MALRPLEQEIKASGMNQPDLMKLLQNIADQVNEMKDDHATNKTLMDELKTDYTALLADVTAIRNAVLAITAKLDLDAGVTDTNYASTTNPAALTATAIAASSAATLSNAVDIVFTRG